MLQEIRCHGSRHKQFRREHGRGELAHAGPMKRWVSSAFRGEWRNAPALDGPLGRGVEGRARPPLQQSGDRFGGRARFFSTNQDAEARALARLQP